MINKQFTDIEGRVYTVKVTIPRLRWIRDEIDVDLGKRTEFIQLSTNPIDLVNVLYMLVKEQADGYELTDVQFGESLDGDTLQAAWEAFGESYLSFCPSHHAKILRQLMASLDETEKMSADQVEYQLRELVASYKSDSKSAGSSELNQETTALES